MSQLADLRQWRAHAHERHLYATAQLIGSQILVLSGAADDAYWLAQAYYATGDYLRGAHVAQPFVSASPHCKYVCGLCLVAAHSLDRALTVLETASDPSFDLDSDPSEIRIDALVCYLMGQIYALRNQPRKARDVWCDALRRDPRCFDALDQLTKHALLSPRDEWQLLRSLDFRAVIGPSAELVRAVYSLRLSKLQEQSGVDNAVDVLVSGYGVDDESSQEILLARADTAFSRSRFESCRKLCERALELDPYNLRTYVWYVGALHELGELADLYRIANELADRSPEEPTAWYAVGVYYLGRGQLTEARRHFSKASIMDPYFAQAWLGFAHTFAEEGEHEQAITAYTTAARLFLGSQVPYLCLGVQNLQLGNYGLAEECLLAAQSIWDEDPMVMNERGVVQYNRDELGPAAQTLSQALSLSQRLQCDVRTLVVIRANLGFVHRRLGNFGLALQHFEEVSRAAALDANILAAMGLVHLQMGDIHRAIMRLNQALAVRRDDPVATDLLNRAMEAAAKPFDPPEPVLDVMAL